MLNTIGSVLPHQLPLQHPAYRYPSSKNPYEKKLAQRGFRVLANNATEERAGSWRALLGDRKILHVEIGSNAGHVVVEWAKANPKEGFIGIDWKYKAIHRASEKAAERGIDNLLLFRSYAERLPFMFGAQEIDYLYLFFPDPWPKKSHWKNRFITAPRLREIAQLMKPGGSFHIKTDHPGYFEWMLERLEEVKDLWVTEELTRDLHAHHPAPLSLDIPEVTLFEKLFIKDGIKINSLKIRTKTATEP